MMKFGVNLVSQHAADRPQRDLYAEMVEQAEVAGSLWNRSSGSYARLGRGNSASLGWHRSTGSRVAKR
jgi:hypothetical protein